VTVARTDDDSWAITESVGATALGVAAARAADTESANPLIDDPFARVFLDAAGDGRWNWFGATELPPELVEVVPDMPLRMRGMRDYCASRTAFFDQFVVEANNAGARQIFGPHRPISDTKRQLCSRRQVCGHEGASPRC
jgi:O-methyltransferase involved in polyketide biosynthesis